MDKGGNFIGWLFVDNTNLSLALVQEGLSKVHFTAERSNWYKQMCTAEENAKKQKLNVSRLQNCVHMAGNCHGSEKFLIW